MASQKRKKKTSLSKMFYFLLLNLVDSEPQDAQMVFKVTKAVHIHSKSQPFVKR